MKWGLDIKDSRLLAGWIIKFFAKNIHSSFKEFVESENATTHKMRLDTD